MGGTKGSILNSYNKARIIGSTKTGGIVGILAGDSEIEIVNCYNKGNVIGTNIVGSIIGENATTGIATLSNLYYLSSLGLGAINGQNDEEKNIKGIDEDLNSYEEFLSWIEKQNV